MRMSFSKFATCAAAIAVIACNSDAGTGVSSLNRVALIAISLTATRLSIGQTTHATVVLKDASGATLAATPVTWTSANSAVATVDQNTGTITAMSVGATSITAHADQVTGSADVTVLAGPPPVQTVSVALADSSIAVGANTQATAQVADANGNPLTDRAVVWKTSDPNVAGVDPTSGFVVGITSGTVMITGTSEGVTGSVSLTVFVPTNPVAVVGVSLASSSIGVGVSTLASARTYDGNGNLLTGRAVTWSTSNPQVATVGVTGVVTGVAAGTATVTASSEGQSGSASITVTATQPGAAPVATVSVSLGASSVAAGGTTQATAVAQDANGNVLTGRTVSWSSATPAVATIDGVTGAITAVSAGTTLITATIEGHAGTATLTVTSGGGSPPPPPPPPVPVASVTVGLGASSVVVGSTTKATATTRDANGKVLTGRTITWTSSNTSQATVSATGVVTGVAAGTVNIIAMSEGKTGSATLTVTAAPPPPVATVSVSLATSSITAGTTTQATATTKDAGGNVLTGRSATWSSSSPSVATVNALTGVVTGVAAGTANIVATSEGTTGSAPVTVAGAPPVPVATVTATLVASSVVAGSTTQATAVTKDASGNILSGRVVSWSSSNTAVATVNGTTGLVTAVSAGAANIIATSETKTGSAPLTVTAAAPPPPPPPPAGPAPVPGANDLIVLDTRQSLQQATNVTTAINLFDPVSHSDDASAVRTAATNAGEGWTLATNIDGLGTHALVCNYVGAARDHDCYVRQALPTKPSEIYIQWTGRFGRMATDSSGSNGAVDAFAWDPAHGFKRINMHRPGDGDRLDFDGSDPDNGVEPHIENSDRNWIREGTITGWKFPQEAGAKPFVSTVYFKTASTNTSSDGVFRLWIDGVLVFERTDVPAGNLPFDQYQIFSTWPSVPQAQCEYLWNLIAWVPQS